MNPLRKGFLKEVIYLLKVASKDKDQAFLYTPVIGGVLGGGALGAGGGLLRASRLYEELGEHLAEKAKPISEKLVKGLGYPGAFHEFEGKVPLEREVQALNEVVKEWAESRAGKVSLLPLALKRLKEEKR